jgi:hypothetical protein
MTDRQSQCDSDSDFDWESELKESVKMAVEDGQKTT